MATIIPRKKKDDSVSYTVQIQVKRKGKIIHHESKTFSKDKSAKTWAKRRELELENPDALQLVVTPRGMRSVISSSGMSKRSAGQNVWDETVCVGYAVRDGDCRC